MNYTSALCGHPVVAVGAPGSAVRRALEGELCDRCAEAVAFAVYPPPSLTLAPRVAVFTYWGDADTQRAKWDADAPEGEESRIVALRPDTCPECGELCGQHAVVLFGDMMCPECAARVLRGRT